jgi:hypothetical protein
MVHYHEWQEEEPLLPDGSINKLFNDSEDLLWVEQYDFTWMAHYALGVHLHNHPFSEEEQRVIQKMLDRGVPRNTGNLDLGWYGGDALTGHYKLILFKGNRDNIVHTFRCRSTAEMKAHLYEVMKNLWPMFEK